MMEETELRIKEMIIKKYGSLKKFCEIIDMPWTTLDSILKRGIANSNITNVMKITKELNIDTESLASGMITPSLSKVDINSNADDFPSDIRAAARGMMDLNEEDKKSAIDMINFLSKRGREAKDN